MLADTDQVGQCRDETRGGSTAAVYPFSEAPLQDEAMSLVREANEVSDVPQPAPRLGGGETR